MNQHWRPDQMPPSKRPGNQQKQDIVALHRARIAQINSLAHELAGVARLIEQRSGAVLAAGGTLNIQPQINFVVNALLRMNKDVGVIEQLQQHGVVARPTPKTNGSG